MRPCIHIQELIQEVTRRRLVIRGNNNMFEPVAVYCQACRQWKYSVDFPMLLDRDQTTDEKGPTPMEPTTPTSTQTPEPELVPMPEPTMPDFTEPTPLTTGQALAATLLEIERWKDMVQYWKRESEVYQRSYENLREKMRDLLAPFIEIAKELE